MVKFPLSNIKKVLTHPSAHPELGFQELYVYLLCLLIIKVLICLRLYSHAHDVYTAFMEKQGFEVTRSFHLETAWKATFSHGTGGRTIGVNSEVSANRGHRV